MDLSRFAAFWPGLPHLWYRSHWTSLFYAILFAAALNLALVSTFYWYQWYPVWLNRVLWTSVVVASIWSAVKTWPVWSGITHPTVSNSLANRLIDAQRHYLQGNYTETETVLVKLLDRVPDDVEAMLLLSTVCRRTNRPKQALLWLQRMELVEASARWRFEIASERYKIQMADRDRNTDALNGQ